VSLLQVAGPSVSDGSPAVVTHRRATLTVSPYRAAISDSGVPSGMLARSSGAAPIANGADDDTQG